MQRGCLRGQKSHSMWGREGRTNRCTVAFGLVGKVTSACRCGDVMVLHALMQMWFFLRFIQLDILKSLLCLAEKALSIKPKGYPLISVDRKVHSWMQPKQRRAGRWRQQGILFTLTSLTNFPTTLAKTAVCLCFLPRKKMFWKVLKTWQGWDERSHNEYQNMAHWDLNWHSHEQKCATPVHFTP